MKPIKSLKSFIQEIREDRITIIIFSGNREIKRVFLRSLIRNIYTYLGLIFIICSIISFINVFHLAKSNKSLKNTIASLEKPVRENSEKIDEDLSISQESTFESSKNILPEINSTELDISDLEIFPTNSNIDISFILKNIQKNRIISGYVTIFAFSEDFDTKLYYSYPESLQINDAYNLLNYKLGNFFSIRWLKNIKATLSILPSSIQIKFIVITLYSRSGEILLRKNIEI